MVSAPHEWLLNTTLISPQQLEKNQPMLNDASPCLLPPGRVCVCVCVHMSLCVCMCYRCWHVDSQPRSDSRGVTICGCIYVCLHRVVCVCGLEGEGGLGVGWRCTQTVDWMAIVTSVGQFATKKLQISNYFFLLKTTENAMIYKAPLYQLQKANCKLSFCHMGKKRRRRF